MSFHQKLRLKRVPLPESYQCQLQEFMDICITTSQVCKKLDKNEKFGRKNSNTSNVARKVGNALYNNKEQHNSKTHHDIFKHYSQAIAYAPEGTDELILGYSNRSHLLMHLQRYDEALVDIDRALNLTNDDEFKTNLLACKEECIKLANEKKLSDAAKSLTLSEKQESLASKLLNFKPSATVSCAADCVGLACNNDFGRYLIATRDIKPGEIVIAEQSQVAYPILNEIYLVCSHCLQTAWNGIPCDKCVFTMYCSEACKKAAMEEYHDIECLMIKYMYYIIWNTENNACDRMVDIRLLVTAIRKEGYDSVMRDILRAANRISLDVILTDRKLQCNKFKSFYNLSHHKLEMVKENPKHEYYSWQVLYLLLEHTNFFGSLMNLNVSAPNFSIDPRVLIKLKSAISKLKYVTVVNEYPFDLTVPKDDLKEGDLKEGDLKECDLKEGDLKEGDLKEGDLKEGDLKEGDLKEGDLKEGDLKEGNLKEGDLKEGDLKEGDLKEGDLKQKDESRCDRTKGIMIAPCCSLLNHSCLPNIAHICVPKRKIIAFATSPIKRGEMLCDSYQGITVLQGDTKSRINIKKGIYFTCKCKACVNNISMAMIPAISPSDNEKIDDEMAKLFPESVENESFRDSIDRGEVSEEVLQYYSKKSELIYKHFNDYQSFVYNHKSCMAYIEKLMSTLYEEDSAFPDD